MARELENLLAQWSQRRGLAPATLGEDGKHYYVFDGNYEVGLSQAGPRIYFETSLGSLPGRKDQAEALLERLMKLQLARSRRSAEVLALTPEGDGLTLFHAIPVDRLDLRHFDMALGAFVNTVAFWSRKLSDNGFPARSGAALPLQIMYP